MGERTNLDDNVGELSLDVSETEVAALLVVNVDPDPVVVRDDVDFLRAGTEWARSASE